MANLSNTRLLRGILQELKLLSKTKPVKDHPMYAYVTDQFHRYQVTEKKVCRGDNEARHMAQTYLCLLESVRKCQELSDQYKGTERTVEDSANLVGLTLPTVKPPE